MLFAWDDSNVEHLSKHNVTPGEAEGVVEDAEAPWPEQKGEGKFVAWGPTPSGRLLQVIFVLKSPEELEFDSLAVHEWADLNEDDRVIYVIHAMDLTPPMKTRYRKRRRH